MTPFELAELIATYAANAASYMAIFITLVSAYLIAAYAVGSQLKKSQLQLLNLVYFLCVIGVGWASIGSAYSAVVYAERLREIDPNSPQSLRITTIYIVASVMLVSFFASLKFMLDARKTDSSKN